MEQYISAIGQDSHRFVDENSCERNKKLILAGIEIPGMPGLSGNSDADVVFHALTNAISGVTCENILGNAADKMCSEGITDSREYLEYAVNTLNGMELVHISISIECKKPKISPYIEEFRKSIAKSTGVSKNSIGITATSGEELTAFGKGLGIQVFCIITVRRFLP